VLEKIAGKHASTSLGFISQIASGLEIALTMLTLERKDARHFRFLSPINIVRQSTFSWHNVMLIASQRPDATLVAGFNT
jgi:hypothetical protein